MQPQTGELKYIVSGKLGDVSITDLAWLAGIVDGEGCISAHKSRNRGIPHISMGIYMTHRLTIVRARDIILRLTGRKIKILQRPRTDRWQETFGIKVGRKSTLRTLLSQLIPFMTTKKEVAECAVPIVQQDYFPRNSDPGWAIELATRMQRLNGPNNARKKSYLTIPSQAEQSEGRETERVAANTSEDTVH